MDDIIILDQAEKNLILYMRQLGWGKIEIEIREGIPVLIIKTIETIKLKG